MRDQLGFLERVGKEQRRVGELALEALDLESALHAVTSTLVELLGDKDAHLRQGALGAGEYQFSVSGVFVALPGRTQLLLLAEVGFSPEQHRLRIGIDQGRPGWMMQNGRPLLLANTDEDPQFTQILSRARMGSVVMAPLRWKSETFGLLMAASQARNTYSQIDLDSITTFADLSSALFIAYDGPDQLARLIA